MTKEITKANILQEMQDKFKMREYEPSSFLFSETVIPVYNIEQHLLQSDCFNSPVTITEIGGQSFYVVPDDEKWFVSRYVVVFVGGTYTVSGVYIRREAHPTNFAYLDLTASQTVSYAVDLPKDAELHPGDVLGINIDDYTASGELRLYIDVTKETLR